MIIQAYATSFLAQMLKGIHNFSDSGGDTFRIALYTNQAILDATTTAYTGVGEVGATGYTAGGASLTNLGVASAGTVGYTSFNTVSWVSTEIVARGALIYNASVTGNPAVLVLNFGVDRSPVSGLFTITFPTNNSQYAIIRIDAPAA